MAVFDVFLADCPARTTLGVIGNTWVAVVLVALGEQPRTYTDLHARIGGISKKMLSQTLRRVVGLGLVSRRPERMSPVGRWRPPHARLAQVEGLHDPAADRMELELLGQGPPVPADL